MNKLLVSYIDLDITLLWWQSFAWDKIWDFYYWTMQDKIVKVRLLKDSLSDWQFLIWQTYDENWNKTNDEYFIKKYFRLDLDFNKIIKNISKDKFIENAIKSNLWLRVLSQWYEQCLLSFILSSSNNIQNIRRSIRLMNNALWKKVIVDWINFYLFPWASVISDQTEEKLREFKIWFRAKYLLESSRLIKNNYSKNISLLSPEKSQNDIRFILKSFPWVWDKIADCVMCFSLWFDDITPIDTWAKKALLKLYKLDEKTKIEDIRKWLVNYFWWYVNFAWHFLFEYVRNNSKILQDVK